MRPAHLVIIILINEEIVPIPDVDPNPTVSVSTTDSMNESLIKAKPTTTPTSTRVSNTYACFGNNNNEDDDDDDDDDDDCTEMPPVLVEIRTLRNTKTNNIPAIKPQQNSNGPDGDDDDNDDDVYAAPLDVGTINNKICRKWISGMMMHHR